MSYYVSMQHYYYSGKYVVEVASGGIDYAGCDMLATDNRELSRLTGEYTNPVDAVNLAIQLVKSWRNAVKQSSKHYPISGICVGNLMDMCEGEITTYAEARSWAEKIYNSLEKCPVCNEIMPDKRDRWNIGEYSEEEYCSEYCANKAYESAMEFQAELEEEFSNEYEN